MNLRHIEVFYAVIQTGSTTAAAAQLNISQPAVSTSLKHYESLLKVKLFQRVGGRLVPTPEAIALYPVIDDIFRRLQGANRFAESLTSGRSGRLNLGAPHSLAVSLSKSVSTFAGQHPDIQITLLALSAKEMLERILSGELDIGITHTRMVNAEILTTPLTNSEIVAVLRSDNPLAAKRSVRLSELKTAPIITHASNGIVGLRIQEALKRAHPEIDIRYQSNSPAVATMMAFLGMGIAIVEPGFLSLAKLPGLVWRPIIPRIPLTVYLVHGTRLPLSIVAKNFVSDLVNSVDLNLTELP